MRSLVLAAVLAGCGITSTIVTPINPAPHPMVPRAGEAVEVYASSPPQRPHVDVALIRVAVAATINPDDRVMAVVRERAAELGCDALFVAMFWGAQVVGVCSAYVDAPPGAR